MVSQQTNKPMPEAVIFDLDGTLISSKLDFRAIREQTGCAPGEDLLRYMETLSSAERSEVAQIIHEHEMEDAHSCELLPGVKAMLQALAKKNIRMAIVTRNSASATRIKLARTGIALTQVITRDDAPPKPAPDALVNLAKHWGVEQKSCVYVGDYVYDLEAARRANMHSALYVDAGLPDFAEQANFVFCHHENFEAELMGYWLALV
jgi:HAD superfamily hydrolase (TIGR01509 family)